VSGWEPIATAPKEPRLGVRGPIIVGVDATGTICRTAWVHEHHKGSNVWLMFTDEGLMEWEPTQWVPDPGEGGHRT